MSVEIMARYINHISLPAMKAYPMAFIRLLLR
jgi:hypothetical protein